jgi:hypothetical protein
MVEEVTVGIAGFLFGVWARDLFTVPLVNPDGCHRPEVKVTGCGGPCRVKGTLPCMVDRKAIRAAVAGWMGPTTLATDVDELVDAIVEVL